MSNDKLAAALHGIEDEYIRRLESENARLKTAIASIREYAEKGWLDAIHGYLAGMDEE